MKNCNNGINFIILATVISIIIAKMLDDDEQNVLGNFLQAIGANISTIAAYDEFVQTNPENSPTTASDQCNNSNNGKVIDSKSYDVNNSKELNK